MGSLSQPAEMAACGARLERGSPQLARQRAARRTRERALQTRSLGVTFSITQPGTSRQQIRDDKASQMAVLESLLLVLALTLVFRFLLNYLHFRRLELAIPGPTSLPVIGSVHHAFGLTPDNWLATVLGLWNGCHTELWRFATMGRMTVFASDPDHLQELFARKDFINKSRFLYKFFDALGGHGLVSLNGAEWRAHRRAFQPAFHQSLLDGFTPVFSAEALGFVRRVRPGEAQDVESNLQSMVTRDFVWTSVSSAGLSEDDVEKNFLPDFKALVKSVSHSYVHRASVPWLWPDWAFFYLTAIGREIRRRRVKVDAFCKRIFAAQRAQLNQKSVQDRPSAKHRSLLDVLMEPGDRLSLSDEEILAELKLFAAASFDTSVATLSWAFKVLSLRQDMQQRLLQEVEEVLGKDGSAHSHITTADLARLEYTERVLKETMRLLPTIPLIARQVAKETDFCGHTLPAGSDIVANILAAHRDPRHWPDPLRFDPDRFLPENSVGRHPYAYIPFSAGPRNCIGSRYAMMSMKTLLATLVPRYRIDPVDDGFKEPADLPIAMGVASRMVGGVRVVFTPRTCIAA